MQKGAPGDNFSWPLALVSEKKKAEAGDTLGYLMPLMPDNFFDMKYFLQGSDKPKAKSFETYYAQLSACIELAYNMSILHLAGWCYQDLNHGNFGFDPKTGKVFILDVDPIIVDEPKANTDVKGMRGYMAPEIPRGKYRGHPSRLTDYYSLAVILYRLMFISHPMEGKRCAECPMWTDEAEEYLYEIHPVFCYDPKNTSNRPNTEWGTDAYLRWNIWPKALQDKFIQAFTDGVDNPNLRVTDLSWIGIFSRIRNLLLDIPNYHEHLVDFNNSKSIPPFCMKMTHFVKNHEIGVSALYPGKTFYLHTVTDDVKDIHTPAIAVAYDSAKRQMLLKNYTQETWQVFFPGQPQDQAIRPCPPGGIFPIMDGVQIQFRKTADTNYVAKITDPKKT
ncbi:MAG: hypothetical protein IJ083_05285 [Clostridia bacterium]|nr:hypothetical protein [Clostridia bacterium]